MDVVATCNPSSRETEMGSLTPRANWLVSIAKSKLQIQGDALPQEIKWGQCRKTPNVNLWPEYMCTHVHTCTYTHVHIHIYAHNNMHMLEFKNCRYYDQLIYWNTIKDTNNWEQVVKLNTCLLQPSRSRYRLSICQWEGSYFSQWASKYIW